LTQSGKVLEPRQGDQLEGGAKGGFFENQLNASIAYFYVKDKNRAIPDPEFPTFYLANGKVRSKGIEAEVSGSPTKGLNIITGYTFLETKYIDDPKNLGKIFSAEEPKHTFKVWGNYDFQSGVLKNANIGLGMRAVTRANRGAAEQPGYAIVNAQIGYAVNSKWSVKASMSNIFDKVYYARIPSNFFGVYGEPRNFMITLRKGF